MYRTKISWQTFFIVLVIAILTLVPLYSCADLPSDSLKPATSGHDITVTYVGVFNRAVDNTYSHVCYYLDGGAQPVCFDK